DRDALDRGAQRAVGPGERGRRARRAPGVRLFDRALRAFGEPGPGRRLTASDGGDGGFGRLDVPSVERALEGQLERTEPAPVRGVDNDLGRRNVREAIGVLDPDLRLHL